MGLRALLVVGAASLALATPFWPAAARAPAPLVPTALVEDVTSKSAEVEFMDYVGSGQVIQLGASDVLVLSYLKSCEHETITGGTVTVGAQRSEVQGGKIVRAKVACDGGNMHLSAAQANASAASAFRLQSADIEPVLYARTPVVQLPRGLSGSERVLAIARVGRREHYSLPIDDAAVAAGFVDLAKAKVRLAKGATYEASIGGRKLTFLIDKKAKSGATPVVSRLLRFQ